MNFPSRLSLVSVTNPFARVRSRSRLIALLATGLCVGTASADRPATFWGTPGGDFFDFANWTLGTPNSSLDARIDNGGTARINTVTDQSVPYVYLGSEQNTSGTLEISGAGVASFTTMIVGAKNSLGTLNIMGGGQLTTFGGPIGSDYLGVGVATVSGTGSSWKITGSEMAVGVNGTGTIRVQDGASLMVANGTGQILLANHPVSSGDLLIGNGGLAGTVSASEILNGEGKATVVFNHSTDLFSFTPKLTGARTVNGYLNLLHNGTGTTVLSAPENNLAGTVTISAGTLVVNGLLKGTTNSFTVEDEVFIERTVGTTVVLGGGTLSGSGFIEGKTTVQGVLAPGTSAGVLTFGGDLSLESTGTVTMEIGGVVRGVQFDGVDAAGALLYGGTLEIVFLDGFDPEDGATFDLFNGFSSQSGQFANIVFSSANYAGTFDPQSGVLTVGSVPEPGVFGLAAVGAALLGMRNRKRRASAL